MAAGKYAILGKSRRGENLDKSFSPPCVCNLFLCEQEFTYPALSQAA